jgi:AcrR family transcriptional regulator
VRFPDRDRRLRRDARANRERLLGAARVVLRERGADAPLEAIAREARVGIGTLYRHFPDRSALLEALAEEHVGHLVSIVEALDDVDGWDALVSFVEQVAALQEENIELRGALLQAAPSARLDDARRRLRTLVERLLVRARASGLRDDFAYGDLITLVWSVGRVVEATAGVAPGAWRRHLAFALDGLRATSVVAAAPGRPLGPRRIAAAHRALSERHRRGGAPA